MEETCVNKWCEHVRSCVENVTNNRTTILPETMEKYFGSLNLFPKSGIQTSYTEKRSPEARSLTLESGIWSLEVTK